MTCTICLEPFEAGQDLSFSRDLKCHHCFHRDWYV
jgi:DNA-directed RNA polymerase subunit RPC12/RpoP